MGRRMGNLSHQINRAIDNAFSEGADKHSYKAENGKETDGKIFSHSDMNNLKDLGRNLMNYFRENGMEVKNIKDIKSEHIQSFLNSKAETCTQNTINQYAHNINKLDLICNNFCGSNWDAKENVITPVATKLASSLRGAEHTISREDYNKILEYAKTNISQSGDALLLQDKLGLRVNEISTIKISEISINEKTITFDIHNTKGGKELIRTIPLDSNTKEILERNMASKLENDKLFNVKGSSINKYLNRLEDKLGIDRYSNHDIRRLIAQEKYKENIDNGMSKEESIKDVSNFLNHRDNRSKMILKSYLQGII